MRTYSLIAPAKINLYLEIIGDRPDGFHELAMVLQSIDLSDRIEIKPIGIETIIVHCDHPQVPADNGNLAYRAAHLMKQEFPDVFARYGGVEITVHKHIPVEAGLAGGSTDAAAVLVGLDLLWKLGLTQSEIQVLGAKLGSDVPFCVTGGTALGTGRGEQLAPLTDLDNLYVILAKYNNLGVSTAWAYNTYRQEFAKTYIRDEENLTARRHQVHSGPMIGAISRQDGAEIGKLLYNDLEKVVLPAHPQIEKLCNTFTEAGVLGAMMSGSGPTVFALTESQTQAEEVMQKVRQTMADNNISYWVTKTIPSGIKVEHH